MLSWYAKWSFFFLFFFSNDQSYTLSTIGGSVQLYNISDDDDETKYVQ